MMRWLIASSLRFRGHVVALAAGVLTLGITQLPKTSVRVEAPATRERGGVRMRYLRSVSAIAGLLLILSATACDGDPPQAATASETPGATSASEAPATDEGSPAAISAKGFDPNNFDDDSATVDNEWFPLVPGTRYVWVGRAFADDGRRIDRRVVFTVTDLTKVIGGVRAVVGWDRDFNDGELGESELIFFAQDKYGNVWHLGEYVEHWNDGEFEGGRVWVVGDPEGSKAGVAMGAEPALGTSSYSQGFAPPPWFWNDLSRVSDVGVRTCVPVDCFDDALVIEEFEPRVPGAYQLKYYAEGVGNIRVGWRGPNEEEREVMVLAKFLHLSPRVLAEARAEALALEHRAYAYARTQPAEPRAEDP